MQTLLCDRVVKAPDSFVITEWRRILTGISQQYRISDKIHLHLQYPSIESVHVAASYWAQFLEELTQHYAIASQKELFEAACTAVGANISRADRVSQLFHESFKLIGKNEKLGFLLAYEVMALDLTDIVLQLMSPSHSNYQELSSMTYFKLQSSWGNAATKNIIIRFLTECKTTDQINDCLNGFKKAMEFWQKFWSACSQEINSTQYRG